MSEMPMWATGQVRRILIVDDNPEDVIEIRRMLLRNSERRYTFTSAENGEIAIRAVLNPLRSPPDCVILDYTLPDMDALEVLPELRAPNGLPVCPVVVLTGKRESQLGRKLLRLGAQDYISKDWSTPESLARSVENAIDRWELARESQATAGICKSCAQALVAEVGKVQEAERAT